MFNIDRHIGISAGWIAGPAFAVAMMAAPEAFHLGPSASALLFWGGTIVFLITVAVLTFVSSRENGKRQAVVAPIILMAMGSITFCVGAAWFMWPHSQKEEPHSQMREEAHADQPDFIEAIRRMPSVPQLRELVFDFTRQMRAFEAQRISERRQQSSMPAALAFHQQTEREWVTQYQPKALALYDELLRRTGHVKPRFPDPDTLALDGPNLAGVNPIADACSKLDSLARELRSN